MPCAGLVGSNFDWNLQFTQGGAWLGAAGCDIYLAQGFEERLRIALGFDDLNHGTDTDAGHKDDEVELSGNQICSEVQHELVGVETDFAHRGHNERITPVRADELFNLLRATRLERENPQSIEVRMRHATSNPSIPRIEFSSLLPYMTTEEFKTVGVVRRTVL